MFSDLIGNDKVKEAFLRMMGKSRFPHSALFVGEKGIGKKLFALEIAKAFLCQNLNNFQACDICTSCKRASIFSFPTSEKKEDYEKVLLSDHPDLGQIISFKRNISVNSIRELEREANFRPFEGKARFFIIDDADKMNDAAANALLKTLEEPSSTTFIFLITSRPMSLMQTIRSRCQIIRFSPIEASKIEEFLLEKGTYTKADSQLLARLSSGSIGRAISLDLENFRLQRDRMFSVLEGILNHKLSVLLQISEQLGDAKLKDEYEIHLEILQTLIHDLWTLQIGGSKIVNVDLTTKFEPLAKIAQPKRLGLWLSEIETVRENLAVNINKKIATDALFVNMANS
jgi:DNA polymerase III subunit delta'